MRESKFATVELKPHQAFISALHCSVLVIEWVVCSHTCYFFN